MSHFIRMHSSRDLCVQGFPFGEANWFVIGGRKWSQAQPPLKGSNYYLLLWKERKATFTILRLGNQNVILQSAGTSLSLFLYGVSVVTPASFSSLLKVNKPLSLSLWLSSEGKKKKKSLLDRILCVLPASDETAIFGNRKNITVATKKPGGFHTNYHALMK